MQFETELKKLGLSDKEAAVYIACLQAGPSPAQQLARKSKVVRATTYVILESLMQRGLVTQYKEGKKTLFSPEPPRQLMRLLEKQAEEIKEQRHGLEQLLPHLQVMMKTAGGKPSVRYFQGREGLHAMRQEIVMYTQPGGVIYSFTPLDHLNALFPQTQEDAFFRQRLAKGIHAKTIFTTRSSVLRAAMLKPSSDKQTERRYVSVEHFPSTSGMTVFVDRIAIGTYVGKLMGVIVESEPMADMMRHLFELAWRGAATIDTK